jgi:ATP-dependent helicase/nuclease subunit A
MEQGILTKYSASAGSGKTFKLTGIYLSKLFQSKNNYKKILAVTFTNKAASEMKKKILDQLYSLSLGTGQNKTDFIKGYSDKTEETISLEAKEILNNILHDYSGFSVGTIDSFFQKVLKAFSREFGLQSGYIIELDHSLILNRAVDDMLAEAGNDITLMNWLTEYAGLRIGEGKNWNSKSDILKLAEEIFKEKFKLLSDTDRAKLRNRELLAEYTNELRSIKSDFVNTLRYKGNKGREILLEFNVDDKDFFYGSKGIPSFLNLTTGGASNFYKPLNSYVQKVLDDPPRWTAKPVPPSELISALNNGFGGIITEAVQYYNENYKTVNTASFILENIYTLGILTDILKHVHIITSAENRFLLSDTGELLYLIIGKDQTPFIYEKVGNVFENYMIDEFQDTSVIQWNNFRPLIENSMAEGHDNLVVGDVKQSIYRWRNSDWRIFGKSLHEQIDPGRLKVEHLDTNWRSRHNIISFNNTLFSAIPEQIDKSNGEDSLLFSFTDLYSDAVQLYPGEKEGGYVKFEFIEGTEDYKFEEIVLRKLPHVIEDLQDKGYKSSDIGILVRKNSEGTLVMKTMLDYKSALDDEKRKKYNYNIISNESLLLSQSPAVNFIISLLSGIYNPDDLSKALTLRNYLLATDKVNPGNEFLSMDLFEIKADKFYPPGYRNFLERAKQLPLFEVVENIIKFFDLGAFPGNAAYLNSFQDCVIEFSGSNSPEITSFLEWWSTTGVRRSIVLSDNQDSMRVMTIHKSKGLQFKAVILPFVSWELNHGRKTTVLWINPDRPPFNKFGLVPVNYKSDLKHSHFSSAYYEEMYSAIIDNLNLLYVAFTRAIDCLFGFCPVKTGSKSVTISNLLQKVLQSRTTVSNDKPGINMEQFYDNENLKFIYGQIPDIIAVEDEIKDEQKDAAGYFVSRNVNRLRLKFHGENYLLTMPEEHKTRLNYGRIMHEIFASISTSEDISHAVNKMILEGKVPEKDRKFLEEKVQSVISAPEVRDWFEPGSEIMNEAEILTVTGTARRPDRVIVKGDKAIVIDFKFGAEKVEYMNQVDHYRNLLEEMGYKNVEAFLWYVDKNKIINV